MVKKTRSQFELAVMQSNERLRLTMYESRALPLLLPTTYLPDLILPNGLVVELKGRHPQVMAALEKPRALNLLLHPNSSLTKVAASSRPKSSSNLPFLGVALLTQTDFKLPRAKKKRISEWCRKNDILWAPGPEIPDAWWELTSKAGYAKLLKDTHST